MKKQRKKEREQEPCILPPEGTGKDGESNTLGRLSGSMEATMSFSPLALWCVTALVPGRRALQHVERQTVLLAPTCSSGQSPGRSWPCGVPVILPTHSTPGTLLENAGQILHEKPSPSHPLQYGAGVTLKETHSTRFYGVVHYPRKVKKKKATCSDSHNRQERILQCS